MASVSVTTTGAEVCVKFRTYLAPWHVTPLTVCATRRMELVAAGILGFLKRIALKDIACLHALVAGIVTLQQVSVFAIQPLHINILASIAAQSIFTAFRTAKMVVHAIVVQVNVYAQPDLMVITVNIKSAQATAMEEEHVTHPQEFVTVMSIIVVTLVTLLIFLVQTIAHHLHSVTVILKVGSVFVFSHTSLPQT